MKSKIKIGLVDDHPIFLRGLKTIIVAENNFEVIWEANNGKDALDKIQENQPDVVVLDVDMPILDGFSTAKKLNKSFPKVKIIFLTLLKDTQIFDLMKKYNIKGYVLKDSALDEIVYCINKVVDGGTNLSPKLTEMLFSDEPTSNVNKFTHKIATLTQTEKKILFLISNLKTSKEIADDMSVSVRTIENHRFNICKKLNLKGNHALFKFALNNKKLIKNLSIE